MAKKSAKKSAKKRSAKRASKKITTVTTSKRVQTVNPRDLEAENEMLRREIERMREAGCQAGARNARVARAARNAGMPLAQWLLYCDYRGASPEVFDRSVSDRLDSDRALAPHRARAIAEAGD